MEAINRDFEKAFKIFESNCLTHSFGPSCNKAGFYLVSGHYTGEADPVSDKDEVKIYEREERNSTLSWKVTENNDIYNLHHLL